VFDASCMNKTTRCTDQLNQLISRQASTNIVVFILPVSKSGGLVGQYDDCMLPVSKSVGLVGQMIFILPVVKSVGLVGQYNGCSYLYQNQLV